MPLCGETALSGTDLSGKPLLAGRLFQQPSPQPGRCRIRCIFAQTSRFVGLGAEQFLVTRSAQTFRRGHAPARNMGHLIPRCTPEKRGVPVVGQRR